MKATIILLIAVVGLFNSTFAQTYTGQFYATDVMGMHTDQYFNLMPNSGATSTNYWNVYHKDGGAVLMAHFGAAQAYVQVGLGRAADLFVNGNSGIGTTIIGPQVKLKVYEAGSSTGTWRGRIVSSGDASAVVMGEYNNVASVGAHNIGLTAWNNLALQHGGGNLGIGTTTPTQKVEISGGLLQNGENAAFGIDAQTNARLGFIKKNGTYPVLASDNGNPLIFSQTNQSGVHTNIAGATITERMRIDANGNLGIGTSTPTQKLTVNGTIYGKEVKVDLSVPGPDYVFEKDYALPSLESIQTYIDQNKHLPEVPSAREMEANGINLSEMNMLLLKKVEELTLYAIEQKSNAIDMMKQMKEQQLQIEQLKEMISKK